MSTFLTKIEDISGRRVSGLIPNVINTYENAFSNFMTELYFLFYDIEIELLLMENNIYNIVYIVNNDYDILHIPVMIKCLHNFSRMFDFYVYVHNSYNILDTITELDYMNVKIITGYEIDNYRLLKSLINMKNIILIPYINPSDISIQCDIMKLINPYRSLLRYDYISECNKYEDFIIKPVECRNLFQLFSDDYISRLSCYSTYTLREPKEIVIDDYLRKLFYYNHYMKDNDYLLCLETLKRIPVDVFDNEYIKSMISKIKFQSYPIYDDNFEDLKNEMIKLFRIINEKKNDIDFTDLNNFI